MEYRTGSAMPQTNVMRQEIGGPMPAETLTQRAQRLVGMARQVQDSAEAVHRRVDDNMNKVSGGVPIGPPAAAPEHLVFALEELENRLMNVGSVLDGVLSRL